MKKTIVAFAVLMSLGLAVPETLVAWGSRAHKKITSDAYYIMPVAFRQFLGETLDQGKKNPNLKALLEAALEPDRVLKDFRNHVFHVQGFDLGNGPFHIEGLAKEIVADIKAKAPKALIIQKLGWVAHYIGDLAQPLHTGVATWEGIEEKSYHSHYEKDMDKEIYSFGVNFDGCQAIQRISARMVYEALWANQYYTTVEYAYTKGDCYKSVGELSAKCYSRGVNNVVDIWYSIWAMSGGKINPAVDGKPKIYPAFWRRNYNSAPNKDLEQ